MKYRKLNEVLIEWGESSKEDSNNVFLKSEEIKKSLDQHFIYRLDKKDQIKIFDRDWSELEKYQDKVWINSKHVELDEYGWTVDWFEPGEYKVYIKDIDKVIDMTYMFYDCKRLVSAFIPNSITSIGNSTFSRCSGLTSMNIPNFINKIDYRAFEGCTSLTSVIIPNSVTTIGDYAFFKCTALTDVEIPNSITSISQGVFESCHGLTSVYIPNSVTFIDADAFYGCKNLKTVYVEDINKFNQIEFENKWSDPRCYDAKVIELKK